MLKPLLVLFLIEFKAAVKELLEVSKDLSKFLLALWIESGWAVVNCDTKSKRLMFRRQYIWESFCNTDIFSGRTSSIEIISRRRKYIYYNIQYILLENKNLKKNMFLFYFGKHCNEKGAAFPIKLYTFFGFLKASF